MVATNAATLELTLDELRLLALGTETLREANPDDPDAESLDAKVLDALESLGFVFGASS